MKSTTRVRVPTFEILLCKFLTGNLTVKSILEYKAVLEEIGESQLRAEIHQYLVETQQKQLVNQKSLIKFFNLCPFTEKKISAVSRKIKKLPTLQRKSARPSKSRWSLTSTVNTIMWWHYAMGHYVVGFSQKKIGVLCFRIFLVKALLEFFCNQGKTEKNYAKTGKPNNLCKHS